MVLRNVQEIGAINLPLAYNGKKRFSHWIGYLFAFVGLTLLVALFLEQWNKVGTVLSMPPPEPISKALNAVEFKNKQFEGGIMQAPMDESLLESNQIHLEYSYFRTCKDYYDSLPGLSE